MEKFFLKIYDFFAHGRRKWAFIIPGILAFLFAGAACLINMNEDIAGFLPYGSGKAHRQINSDLTVMSALFDDPTGYGRIVNDENGKLLKIIEQKDASDAEKAIKEVNAGIYCLDWQKIEPAFSCLKNDNAQGEYYLTDIISWAV